MRVVFVKVALPRVTIIMLLFYYCRSDRIAIIENLYCCICCRDCEGLNESSRMEAKTNPRAVFGNISDWPMASLLSLLACLLACLLFPSLSLIVCRASFYSCTSILLYLSLHSLPYKQVQQRRSVGPLGVHYAVCSSAPPSPKTHIDYRTALVSNSGHRY